MTTREWQSLIDMKSSDTNRRRFELSEADYEQVRAALNSIEAAQLMIDEARRQLCAVVGFGYEWSRLGEVHDTIKAGWHDVNDRLGYLQRTE